MSKRSKRRRDPGTAGGADAAMPRDAAETDRPPPRRPGRSADQRAAPAWGLGVQLGFLAAVFAVVVLVAELAGAANLGVALGIGQIAFAIAAVYLLVRR